ncbi:MAG: GatB/YqeY domain-containing protein, partial [bacterium]|nr:GatB/YqeY domain-containing protein [bacterium]
MSILAKLTEEMKTAMKARDSARLSAVRMLISSLKYALVDKPEMTEADEVAILTKEAKKR